MTILETVALDQKRWVMTALSLKESNWARYRLMALLSLAGSVLMALALQMHTAYPVASQTAGYTGAVALALVLVVRATGLSRERAQAWVLAAAAAQSLKSEMYRYRTSVGPYSDRFTRNPDATLLRRRDAIFEKVKSIQKYIGEPDSKSLGPLGPLDADEYISERINGELSKFRKFSKALPEIQATWLKLEDLFAIVAVLLAVVLIFTRNQVYGAWVIVTTFLSIALGASTKSERYATLTVEFRTMPHRLTSILERWQANQNTLEDLVERIEAAILAEGENWVAVLDEDPLEDVSLAGASSLGSALQVPASRVNA